MVEGEGALHCQSAQGRWGEAPEPRAGELRATEGAAGRRGLGGWLRIGGPGTATEQLGGGTRVGGKTTPRGPSPLARPPAGGGVLSASPGAATRPTCILPCMHRWRRLRSRRGRPRRGAWRPATRPCRCGPGEGASAHAPHANLVLLCGAMALCRRQDSSHTLVCNGRRQRRSPQVV